MAYLVLSRKYRPRTFEEVVGQPHITRTLQKAIETGRVAQAYIFAGTRGTGKTTMARILAKALNCVHGPTPLPCNECDVCRSVDSGEDVDVIEIDGASHNSVEDVRELRSNASYTPARARYKIYYIDEVHMLSNAAFNALLKTLEEPPAHVKFIFATTEPHKIPLTIQSRCQRFDFRNISAEDILKRLDFIAGKEGIKTEDAAMALIARFASGSMRDAESLFDQVVSFSGEKLTAAAVEEVLGVVPAEALSGLVRALAAGDTAKALEGIEEVLSGGTSSRQFVSEFIDYLRDVLVAKTADGGSKLLVRSAAEREMIAQDAAKWDEGAIIYAMQLLSETYARMARSPQSRGLLDTAIVKLSRVDDFQHLREFLDALRAESVEASGGRGRGAAGPSGFSAAAGPPAAPPRAAAPNGVEGLPRGVWAAVLGAARGKGTLVAKSLEQARSVTLDGEVLKVLLPGNFAPQKAALERDDVKSALESAASEALGRKLRLEVSCDGASAAPAAQEQDEGRKKALKDQALSNPAVKKVLDAFDGSIVDVEE